MKPALSTFANRQGVWLNMSLIHSAVRRVVEKTKVLTAEFSLYPYSPFSFLSLRFLLPRFTF